MTSSVLTAPSPDLLEGWQQPRILYVPEHFSTETGKQAVELAAAAGLVLDPWEQTVLEYSMAENAAGKWVSFEVGLVVSRQNGKGSILEARELAGLFLLDEQVIIHSAHRFETSLEAFRRILGLIESVPDFDRRVKRVSKSHGDEGIELKTGQRLRFKTRTASGGRGLTGDTVMLDEAMILPIETVGALMPTLSAKSIHGNPQIWYTGSAGNLESHVLGKIRRRALAGGDPSLCYIEWSVDEHEYEADKQGVALNPQSWAQANPGLGIRISAEHVSREQRSMDAVEFARERLGVGEWPPDFDDGAVIPSAVWAALLDPGSTCGDVIAFAVDMRPDRAAAVISAAGIRADGKYHVETLDSLPGSDWVVDRLRTLAAWRPVAIVIDPSSPAGSLIPELEGAGIALTPITSRQLGAASAMFLDAVHQDNLRHLDDPDLASAVRGATQRPIGDGAFAWNRKNLAVDISYLVSATLALWGFVVNQDKVTDITQVVW